MSALPVRPGQGQVIPGQEATTARIHTLVTALTAVLLQQRPELEAFVDHRPPRDRPSGDSWQGTPTLCHLSALRAAVRVPHLSAGAARALLEAADQVAAAHGMRRRSEATTQGVSMITWIDDHGDLLELVLGVRVAVRAISAPFLPDRR